MNDFVFHQEGKTEAVRAFFQGGELSLLTEIFLVKTSKIGLLSNQVTFKTVLDNIIEDGVIHFGAENENLFGEGIGSKVTNLGTGLLYEFTLPTNWYNGDLEKSNIGALVLVGGARDDAGGIVSVQGVLEQVPYGDPLTTEIIFGYQILDQSYLKLDSNSMVMTLEVLW